MIDQLIHVFLQSSWQILLLGLIVWPLSRLSIRAYPNFAYSLWVVILLKALIPINFTLPSQQIPVLQISPIITGQFIQTATLPSPALISTSTLIFMVWVAVVFFLLVKLLVSEISHRNQMKTAEALVPDPWFEDMKTTLGIKQEVQLFTNARIQSPLMQGLWHVRIYLPRPYKSWTTGEQKSVLAHELMHIKRKDIIVIYLQALVRTLYFFHPMVWLVNDQIDLEREKICDDAAIDLAQSDRGSYGHQLFKQLSSLKGEKSTPVLAGGFFMTDSSVIKRFKYIKEKRGYMKNRLKLYHILLIVVVCSVAILIACNTDTQQVPTEPATLEKAPILNDNVVFQAYDAPPTPVGGYAAIQEAIKYPKIAREAGIEGTVIVQAVIDTSGIARDLIVLRGVDEMLDLAALAAIVSINWNPAQKAGEPVAVKISVPIVFRLQSDEVLKKKE